MFYFFILHDNMQTLLDYYQNIFCKLESTKFLILHFFWGGILYKIENVMTIREIFEKYDYLQNKNFKNHSYSKFYADSNGENRF